MSEYNTKIVEEMANNVVNKLNKLKMDGDYLNFSCTVDTYVEFVEETNSGYEISLMTYDLKIGGPDDNDENDSTLEYNLIKNFKSIANTLYPKATVSSDCSSEKGHWYMSFAFKEEKVKRTKIQKLEEEKVKFTKELNEFNDKIYNRILNQKSNKKTCKNCDSSVTTSYFKSHKCPVCNAPSYTDTDKKRFDNLTDRINKRTSEIKKLINKK